MCTVFVVDWFLQVPPLFSPSPVLASLKMSVELWMSLWAGHWVVETVLISTSSTSSPMLPKPQIGDFWTSPLVASHNMNWLVSWQAMSTISQYVVSTAAVRRGGRVRITPQGTYVYCFIIFGIVCTTYYMAIKYSELEHSLDLCHNTIQIQSAASCNIWHRVMSQGNIQILPCDITEQYLVLIALVTTEYFPKLNRSITT